jgi:hypothetical protein
MKMQRKYFLIVLLVSLFCGCKSIELKSYWRDREIKIDGNGDDWQGKTWVIKDLPNVAVGFMNDDKYLYLSLSISDRSLQRQIMFRGLTLWFDRSGGEEKKLGIHYPLGMGMMDAPMNRRRSPDEFDRMRDSMPNFPDKFSNEVEILGPAEGEHQRMKIQETGGIEIALRSNNGLLVYEMKIPLEDNGPKPYAIGTTIGSIIGVGAETESNSMRSEGGDRPRLGDSPGSGFGGRRGGMRGGGAPPSGTRENREPLKLWAKVQLAEADSANAH